MSEEAIDLEDVLERVQDDQELLLELLEIFQEDFVEKRKLLEGLIEQKNYNQVRDIAHSMKGAAGNISAKSIHETCAKMETMAENEDLNDIQALILTMDEQFKALVVFADEYKRKFSS